LHRNKEQYTESGLKLPGLDLVSLATQGACAGAQPNAYTGYGITRCDSKDYEMRLSDKSGKKME